MKTPYEFGSAIKYAMSFHDLPYRAGHFLFGNTGATYDGVRPMGYAGAGAVGAGLGGLVGAYNAEKGKKLRGLLRGGLIGAGTGLGARAAGGAVFSGLNDSVLNTQYPALAAALGGGLVGSAAGAGLSDGVENIVSEEPADETKPAKKKKK